MKLHFVLIIFAGLIAPFFFVVPSASAQADIFTPVQIESDAIVKVWVASSAEIEQLQMQYDVWDHGNHRLSDPWVLVAVSPADYAALLEAGWRVELELALTTWINTPRSFNPTQLDGIPNYECYRTVEETFSSLDTLDTTYPDLVSLVDLGDSWVKTQNSGGYDIRGIVLTNEAIAGPKPKFFIMAATHAREYATAELATRFAEHVLQNYGVDPDITWMLDYFELHIVPQANPDGRKLAESDDIWHRKNANTNYCAAGNLGVDLNRNMSWEWSGGAGSCNDSYPGPSSLSEPENVAIANYAQALFPDLRGTGTTDAAPATLEGVFVTVHSYGEYVLPTWAYTTASTSPNAAEIYTLGRKMGYYNNYFVCGTGDAGCLGAASGTHDDFVYGELGVPSYTLELGTQFHQSCSSFESTIYPDNLDALLYTFKATRRPYQAPSGPEVVDLSVTLPSRTLVMTNVVSVISGTILTLEASVDDTRYDSNGGGVEPTQNIAAVRYSIDAPTWITGTISTTVAAADGVFDASAETIAISIDTSTLSFGRHTIFIEGQDALGNWGVPSAYFVTVTDVPVSVVYLPIVINEVVVSAETISILFSTLSLISFIAIIPSRAQRLD